AATTATNQVALGGAGSSVQVGDIDASTDAQVGPVDVVTVDANGTLGRQQAASAQSVSNVRVALNAVAQVSDAQFNALSVRTSTLEGRVDTLFDLSDTVDRDAKRGIASIAAQANPHFPSAAGKTSYASNVATYRGEVGFSAGLTHRFEGDFAITAGVTYAGGNSTSVRAGIAGEF
ncbi:MAG: YadA C-terminal domain-containing protein, partial [Erythrobacter sp.]